jgi:hypothetical protein
VTAFFKFRLADVPQEDLVELFEETRQRMPEGQRRRRAGVKATGRPNREETEK